MKNYILAATLLIFVIQSAFAGGPWPKQKGTAYIKLSEWWTVFDEHYTDIGFVDPNTTTGIFNTNLYLEYGLTDRLTALVNANIVSRNTMNNIISGTTNEIIVTGEGITSLGDIDLGLKYGLTRPGAKIPLSVSLQFGLPLGKTSGGEQGNLQTGDGEFNQILQVDAGTGFNIGKTNAYFSTYVGFNNRTEGFSEEFRYGFEFGLGLFNSRLWLNARLTAVESLKNGVESGFSNSTSIFANNAEFTSFGVEANIYVTKKFGISAGTAAAFRGEIIASAPSYSVGFFLDI